MKSRKFDNDAFVGVVAIYLAIFVVCFFIVYF